MPDLIGKKIEILDTTLRDGEQTSGVSFTASEKLTLAKLLLNELKVDRIEVASARVSDGEFQAVKDILQWASKNNVSNRVEVLTFLDGGQSLKWLLDSKAKVQNILTKGSLNHLKHQLKLTPKQHYEKVRQSVSTANQNGICSNVYLEDWSNGMRHSKDYVLEYIRLLVDIDVKRILLPDTLGILNHYELSDYLAEVTELYPNTHFDFHGHNDYDLGVANALEAVKSGINGLHLTINGMGERAGNAPLESVVVGIKDFFPKVKINVDESALFRVSKLVATFTGLPIPKNKPVVGANVFTQTAGIHADGDKKNDLYHNDLLPERFSRSRRYDLGKTSGKANVEKNLQELGLTLDDEQIKKVTKRVIEMGDKKEQVTIEDLPFIISDVLGNSKEKVVKIKSYVLTHSKGLKPSTSVSVQIGDQLFEENASGDGQYDAFWNALNRIYSKQKIELPTLIDYFVRIPPGSSSDSLCETTITWEDSKKHFRTRGLDSDQTVSAIKATEKMLNMIYET
ncbi:MAG: 2-isopropylmalate synthase [Flavobacteriaceae bacterium]|nr:2-isopropylmalate synthase [Flavobacteriaceae bacterium]MCY4217583.1 2-isopropylmalate synthase [Flavobacteriaceae bacterium]MCY4266726.1 2-isopropylmalate synthase [Flavobacteriaceae bacterium]MCY4297740.1 2-isopropylmalate synthase [Flavobacteriaceae bacterium]